MYQRVIGSSDEGWNRREKVRDEGVVERIRVGSSSK